MEVDYFLRWVGGVRGQGGEHGQDGGVGGCRGGGVEGDVG